MWVAELKVWDKEAHHLELTRKLDVLAASYYLNSFKHGRHQLISKVMTVSGKDKEEFIKRMHSDRNVKFFHAEADQLYYCIAPHRSFHNAVLDRSLFFVKPIISKGGFEYWTVASWEKESIHSLLSRINKARPFAKAQLISLTQQNLNFFIPSIFSKLTSKQLNAIELAFENGYYEFPRKISAQELAKIAHQPRTTFQEHLRKAEAKLLPAVISQLSFKAPKFKAVGRKK